jgi:hypothetical protein
MAAGNCDSLVGPVSGDIATQEFLQFTKRDF